jgi:hypothetical protein
MAEQKRTLYAFHGRPSSNPIKIAILLEELGLEYSVSSLSVYFQPHLVYNTNHLMFRETTASIKTQSIQSGIQMPKFPSYLMRMV